MVWLGDRTNRTHDVEAHNEERRRLLYKREMVVAQIEALKASPCGTTQTAINGRAEDLAKLAKKVISIDKKLGRTS